jgi:hypothetical protein
MPYFPVGQNRRPVGIGRTREEPVQVISGLVRHRYAAPSSDYVHISKHNPA